MHCRGGSDTARSGSSFHGRGNQSRRGGAAGTHVPRRSGPRVAWLTGSPHVGSFLSVEHLGRLLRTAEPVTHLDHVFPDG